MARRNMIVGIATFMLIISAYFIIKVGSEKQDMSVINKIAAAQKSKGIFKVAAKVDIGVNSIEDITYEVKNDRIIIYFGRHTIVVFKESLKDETFVTALGTIGIEIKKHEEKYSVRYMGEVVKECVLVYN